MGYKIQCAYESQQQTACDLVIEHLNASIQFEGYHLVTPDYIAIGYVMAKTPVPLSLTLTCLGLKNEAVSALLSKNGGEKWLLHTLQCSVTKLDETQVACIGKLVSNAKSLHSLRLDAGCKSADHNLDSISSAAGALRTSIVEFSAKKISVGPKFLKVLLSPAQCLQKLVLVESIGTAEVKVLNSCLKNCKNLKDLNIDCNNLQDRDATLLAEGLEFCTKFETISMWRNKFERKGTTDILQHLKNAPLNITIRKLSSYPKSQFWLDELSNCKNLRELHLNTVFTKSMSYKFAFTLTVGWQKLHTLELDHIEIHQLDDIASIASHIAHGFKNLTGLEVLKIKNIPHQHFSTFSSGLKHCTGLITLDIIKNFITHKEVVDLTGGLGQCKKIQNLNLSSNTITDRGVEAVLASIKNKDHLRSLNLHHNKITAKGCVAISTSLQHCTALTLVDLGKNKIGKEGANEISKCLQHWPNLQTLDLSGQILVKIESNIGRDGTMVIAENLHCCTQLESVCLSHNDINDDDVIEVAVRQLAQCKKLIKLDFLRGNGITMDRKTAANTIFRNRGVELL